MDFTLRPATNAAGVLTVTRRAHELHLTWVAVLARLYGVGLGAALIRRAQDEAAGAGLPTDRLAMRWMRRP